MLILGAAPLSLAGALLALIVTGTELNVSSAMGLVLLIGLVVKNGIVLLDYAERERDRGVPAREAVLRCIAGPAAAHPDDDACARCSD